jgi:hypothetical protein
VIAYAGIVMTPTGRYRPIVIERHIGLYIDARAFDDMTEALAAAGAASRRPTDFRTWHFHALSKEGYHEDA